MLPRIKLIDVDGNLLYEGILYRLPLREEEIISYGLAFYQVSELCFWRREAVRKKIYMELEERLNQSERENEISLEELGEFKRFVDF